MFGGFSVDQVTHDHKRDITFGAMKRELAPSAHIVAGGVEKYLAFICL